MMSKKRVQQYWAIGRMSDKKRYVAECHHGDFIGWASAASDAYEFRSLSDALGEIANHDRLSFADDEPVMIRVYEVSQ